MLAALHAKDPISWEVVIGALVKANETRLTAQVEATHASYDTACKTLLGVSTLAVLFAAGFGYVIFFGIRKNMQQVVDVNVNLEALVKPRELTLEQMPRRTVRDGVVIDLEYKQVSGDARSRAADPGAGCDSPRPVRVAIPA